MGVRPGYKQTEAGVVPEDWKIMTIGEVAETSSGTTPPRAYEDRYYRNGHIPWVKTLDLNNSRIHSTEEQVTQAALNETSLRCYPQGSVVIAMYGGFNQIGRTGLLCMPATVNQAITAIRPNLNRVRSEYLLSVLNFRVDYWKSVASSSRKDPNITSTDIRDFPLALPGTDEQDTIAGALSDADTLIESLENVLAKKRQIRLGAMRALLSGKKRLPGFSEEWEVVKSGDIGRFRGGSGFPIKFQGTTFGEYPLFKVSDMNNAGNEVFMEDARNYITEALRRQLGATAFPAGSIVFAKVGAAVFLERKRILAQASCLDNNMAAFVFDPCHTNCRFMHYTLLNTKLGDLVSTTALPSLSGSVLAAIELGLPPLAEQEAIATILSDMDAEITALEAKLAKARQIKQGMMQELLTGRIRLV